MITEQRIMFPQVVAVLDLCSLLLEYIFKTYLSIFKYRMEDQFRTGTPEGKPASGMLGIHTKLCD